MTFILKGYSLATPTVIDVELNDVDVDRMLTHLLELAVKRGRKASSRVNTKDYPLYLAKLQSNPHVQGFRSEGGLDVLDGWIRTSVLKQERASLRRDRVQMGYLRPLTIASYRSGLPKTSSRNRRADALAYRSMEMVLKSRGIDNTSEYLQKLWTRSFGQGVSLGEAPWTEPCYDGESDVDIDTMLALRFLEGFEGNANLSVARAPTPPPVPQAVEPMGEDLVDLLQCFGPNLPVAEAFSHVSALLSLRLFQLPLVTARHVRAALSGVEIEARGNPSEMYCDFTGRRGGNSDELSRLSVIRDLEIMRTFFGDRILMRTLEQSLPLLPSRPDLPDEPEERMLAIARLQDDPFMQMALLMTLQQIENEVRDDDEARVFIAEVKESEISPAEKVKTILSEGLRKRGLENQVKWFWSTGGIDKSYGLISGTKRSRTTWRYSPTDEALTALLALCFVEDDGRRTAPKLTIYDVLSRLEDRFGILIARPPSDLDSADARAGASENLVAFTRRIQLLGCFSGLSDDFNAQFVTRPRKGTDA